jgi:hypothetical protein
MFNHSSNDSIDSVLGDAMGVAVLIMSLGGLAILAWGVYAAIRG